MARKAATSSISSCPGMTMAGRSSRMAPTIGAADRQRRGSNWTGAAGSLLGSNLIAPSGLALEFDPSHRIVWMSTWAAETSVRLTFGDGCTFSEDHFLEHRLGRLRDVRIDPSGVLYLLTDGPEGMLYRRHRAEARAAGKEDHL